MSITIKDLANELKLAPSTVSRALHDNKDISSETRKRVKELADKLGYQPNFLAHSLRTKSTHCIGVIIPEMRNFFFSSVLSSIQKIAFEKGYQLIICQSGESEKNEINYLDRLASGWVDGILISISGTKKSVDKLTKISEELPVVVFDRVANKGNLCTIEAQDYEGAYNATKLLIDKGCKKIIHLGGNVHLINSQRRASGYIDALNEYGGYQSENTILQCDFDVDQVGIKLAALLESGVTFDGIISANDEMAIAAIKYLQSKNISIPDEVKVVGFGNNPISQIVEPNLTTIDHDPEGIGQAAFQSLIRLIDGNTDLMGRVTTIESELIIRGSS